MSILSNLGVVGGGGGSGGASVLTVTDLVGTSSLTDDILTIPAGCIVQLGGEYTRPRRCRTRLRWGSRLNSTPYVYMGFRMDSGDDADFVGYAGRVRWSGSYGWAEWTGTLASPTVRDDGSITTLSGGVGDDVWLEFEFSVQHTSGANGEATAYVRRFTGSNAGSWADQAIDATDVTGDWSNDADPAPTATFCIYNGGTDDVEIDLNTTFVDLADRSIS